VRVIAVNFTDEWPGADSAAAWGRRYRDVIADDFIAKIRRLVDILVDLSPNQMKLTKLHHFSSAVTSSCAPTAHSAHRIQHGHEVTLDIP
jgi:hypothetical protein